MDIRENLVSSYPAWSDTQLVTQGERQYEVHRDAVWDEYVEELLRAAAKCNQLWKDKVRTKRSGALRFSDAGPVVRTDYPDPSWRHSAAGQNSLPMDQKHKELIRHECHVNRMTIQNERERPPSKLSCCTTMLSLLRNVIPRRSRPSDSKI